MVRHDGVLRLLDREDLGVVVGHLMEPVSGAGSWEAHLIDIDDDEEAADATRALLAGGAGGVIDASVTALDQGHNIRAERRAGRAA